jgi:23S rRNA U2552 (ribose-2'-O)-methylase RlmE/FtsJ
MSTETTKPPWTRVQWYTGPKQQDISFEYTTGDWQEAIHEEAEILKEQIQPYDKTELWDLAKRITNPYELINTYSSRLALPPSVCLLKPLSRSYFKMIEMLQILQFFDRHKPAKFKTLHICEGPGGFMEAFTSLAEYNKRKIQACYGMTLKSTHTMIPGWRRANTFLQKNPHIQLLYGPTKTGDIYIPENQQACHEAVGNLGAHLVTSDGGFDFSDDFHAQEKKIFKLLVSSAIILLECVANEGDIILKFFDCNSQATCDLLALLASCFKSWTLYKPVTSRPCNSEWYFLGKSAFLHRESILKILKQVRDGLAAEPPVEYTTLLSHNSLIPILQTLQENRVDLQVKALKEVLAFCKVKETLNLDELWKSQILACAKWCYTFHMPTNVRI